MKQAFSIIEMVGNCSFILLTFEDNCPEALETPDSRAALKSGFATIFENLSRSAESLNKLVKLTKETYR